MCYCSIIFIFLHEQDVILSSSSLVFGRCEMVSDALGGQLELYLFGLGTTCISMTHASRDTAHHTAGT